MQIIGQIIDKDTQGLKYLETVKQELLVIPELSLEQTFIVEILETEPVLTYVEEKEITLNINELTTSIRETITNLLIGK